MNEVNELLAKVVEAEILLWLMSMGKPVTVEVPLVSVKTDEVEGVKRTVVKIDTDSRRLIRDPDFGWLWYNAEGPEA